MCSRMSLVFSRLDTTPHYNILSGVGLFQFLGIGIVGTVSYHAVAVSVYNLDGTTL